jgi:PAS domain S-box-containing protein
MKRPILDSRIAQRVMRFTSTCFAVKDATGHFLDVNPAFCRLTGYSREELIGRHHSMLTFPGDLDATEAVLKGFREHHYVDFSWKKRYVGKDGRIIHCRKKLSLLDGEGPSSRLILQIEDLAIEDHLELDREEAFEALKLEHERTRTTLSSIGDGVISTDVLGKIDYMNPVAEKLTGWSLSQALGRPIAEVFKIFRERSGEAVVNPIVEVLLTGQLAELARNTRLIARTGEIRSIGDIAAPVHDSKGSVRGAVLIFRDITDSQILMEHIQNNERLESLGVLAGGIAHDFNNLMGGIFANIELVRLRVDSNSTQAVYLDRAIKSFHRATDLTRQLLTFAKGGTPVLVLSSVEEIVRGSAELALTGKVATLNIVADPFIPQCSVDPNLISQVFSNLVINALEAMPDGGSIDIVEKSVTVSDEFLAHLRPGRYVEVSVSDHGPGIPDEILTRIFDPFFTTKPTGHGLGLSICKSIVNRHDGDLQVRTTMGKGTTFKVYLPAVAGPNPMPSAEVARVFQGKGTVLVMDDDEELKEALASTLVNLGFQTINVADGNATLAHLRKRVATDEHLVAAFLDLTIRGGMGGKETATAIRAQGWKFPLFVCSGYSDDPILAKPQDFGFSGTLTKPFLMSDVVRLMGSVVPQDPK